MFAATSWSSLMGHSTAAVVQILTFLASKGMTQIKSVLNSQSLRVVPEPTKAWYLEQCIITCGPYS